MYVCRGQVHAHRAVSELGSLASQLGAAELCSTPADDTADCLLRAEACLNQVSSRHSVIGYVRTVRALSDVISPQPDIT